MQLKTKVKNYMKLKLLDIIILVKGFTDKTNIRL